MKGLLLLLLPAFAIFVSAQTPSDSLSKKNFHHSRFLPGPVLSYSTETSLAVGFTAYYTFFYDRIYPETRPSIAYATTYYTLKKQLTNDIYINTWTSLNENHYLFTWSYYRYNYFFYGIGDHTQLADGRQLDQDRLEFSGNGEKRIAKSSIYLGGEFDYKRETYPINELNEIAQITNTPVYPDSPYLRAGPTIISDNRNNAYYTTKGHLYRITYTQTFPEVNPGLFFRRYFIETRNFYTINAVHTFGFNTNLLLVNGEVPFYELAQMGGEYIMRGYYTGRFRDNDMFVAQLEYRWHFHPKIGMVAFIGGGTVFHKDQVIGPKDIKPDVGLGLRLFYDPRTGINIRMDYGVGQPMKGEPLMGAFYLAVGEAF